MARSREDKQRSRAEQNAASSQSANSLPTDGKAADQLPEECPNPEVEEMRRRIAELEVSHAECKRIENELIDANRRTATILESITDAFFALDRQWRFTYVNKQAEVIMRHSREFLLGKNIWNVFPDAVSSTFDEQYHEAIQGKAPVVFEEFYRPYNIWAEVHAYPCEDGLAVYFRDITERRYAELTLIKEEAKYRSLYNAVEAGITVIDSDAHIIEANEKALEMLCVARDQLIGMTPMAPRWGAIHEDGSPFPDEANPLMVALHTGQRVHGVVAGVLHPDGERRWMLVNAQPITEQNTGIIMGAVATFMDITERKRAEEAIARLANIVESSDEAIGSLTLDGLILSWNPGAERLYGYSAAEIIGKSIITIIPQDRLDELHHNMERIKRGERNVLLETGRLTKDGRRIEVAVSMSPVKNHGGGVVAVSWISRDITRQKRIEEALKDSEKRYRILAQVSPVGIFYTDVDGNCLYVNERWCEMTGLTRKRALGKGWSSAVHPDDRKRVEADWFRSAGAGLRFRSEYRFLTLAGRITWVLGEAEAEREPGGEIVGYVGTITDITARKKVEEDLIKTRNELDMRVKERTEALAIANEKMIADIAEKERIEESLEESEERFRALSEASFEAIIIHERGVAIEVNQVYARMFGYEPSELIGKFVLDFVVAPESRETVIEHVRREMDMPYETVALRKDGTTFLVEVNAKPITYHGRPVRVAAIRDITERKRYEEALRQSEEKYRSIVETAQEGIWIRDVEGKTTFVNDRMAQMLGYTVEEMTGKPMFPFIDKEWQAVLATHMELRRQGISEQLDFKFRRRDGTSLWTLVSANPIYDREGKYAGALGMLTDITDRKQAEKALQDEKEFVENLVQTAPVIVLFLDTHGRIVRFNSYLEQISGYRLEEVEGKDWVATFLPEADRDQTRQVFLSAIGDIQTHGNINPIITKDGRLRLIEWYDKTIKDAAGHVIGLLSTGQDITERNRAEETLRASEERFRTIFSESPIGIELYNAQGELLDANEACLEIFGVADNALIKGFKLFEVPNVTQEAKERLEKGETVNYVAPYDFEAAKKMVRYKIKRSGVAYLDVVITPLRPNGADVTSGYLVQIQDVSERKRAEDFREEYISLTSHDLRAPLTVMQGQTEWLQRLLLKKGLTEEAKRTEAILKSTRRMNSMIQDMVESARLESGRMVMTKVPTDILHLINDIAGRVGTFEERARIHTESAGSLPPVWLDPERIERAVVNLVTNALKYSPAETPVVIRVEKVGSEIVVSVTDKGVGIPPEDIPHLFGRFYRAGTSKKMEGLGLGLYITRLIVEAHSGRVWVESQVEKGSIFYFTLPIS